MKRLLNNRLLTHPILFLGIRLLVGGVFLLFGLAKAIEPQQAFYASVRAYEMLPDVIVPGFATLVLVLEIVFGLAVVLGIYTRASMIGLATLLLMFMIAIAQAMIRGLYLPDCGCSGSLIRLGDTPPEVLIRDAVLFVAILWAIVADRKQRFTVDRLLKVE